jgi:hypothetical protein
MGDCATTIIGVGVQSSLTMTDMLKSGVGAMHGGPAGPALIVIAGGQEISGDEESIPGMTVNGPAIVTSGIGIVESVTVTEYIPAVRPVGSSPIPDGDQAKV